MSQIRSNVLIISKGNTNASSALRAVNSNGDILINVLDDGNVGIGTLTPTYRFEVHHSPTNYILFGGGNTTIKQSNTAFLQFGFNYANDLYIYGEGIFITNPITSKTINNNSNGNVGVLYNYNANDYLFKSYDNLGINYFEINHSGYYGQNRLGVNVSPTATLHVKGVDSTVLNFALKVDNLTNSPLLYVRNDGNVGIGLNSPTARLDILSQDDIIGNYGIKWNNNTATRGISVDNDGTFTLQGRQHIVWANNASFTVFDIYAQSGQIFNISGSNDGNVLIGIGGVDTSAKLLIRGVDSTASNYALKVDNNLGDPLLYVRNNQIVTIKASGGFTTDVTLGVAGFTHTYGWKSRGYNKIEYGINDFVTGDARPMIEWDNSASPSVFLTGLINDDKWGIYAGSGWQFSVDKNTGNVGIGTENASAELHVKGTDSTSAYYALKVDNSAGSSLLSISNDGRAIFSYGLSVLGTNFGHTFVGIAGYSNIFNIGEIGLSNSYFQINTGGTFKLGNVASDKLLNFDNTQFWFNNANVGVGISSPVARLQIQGTDSTSSNYALKVDNSTNTNLFSVRNDGQVNSLNGYSFNGNRILQGDSASILNIFLGYYDYNNPVVNSGIAVTAIGYNAGQNNSGTHTIGIGAEALLGNSGGYSIGLGVSTLKNNSGGSVFAFGYYAASSNSGSNVLAFGNNSAENNTLSNVAIFGKSGTGGGLGYLDFYIGTGIDRTNETIHYVNLRQGTAKVGELNKDMSSAPFNIVGAVGTGTGAGGNIVFQIAKAGPSGTTQNILTDSVIIRNDGEVLINSLIGTGTRYVTVDVTGKLTTLAIINMWIPGSAGIYSIKANNPSGLDATGDYSLAEGYLTTASGNYSHSEGFQTTSSGQFGHAEGYLSVASGQYSHAEGQSTTAGGDNSHAQGYLTIAAGGYSHAEGYGTTASGDYSHAGGMSSTSSGPRSFVHGANSTASGIGTVVLGDNILGTADDTTYVNLLNVKIIPAGIPINNIAVNANGDIISTPLFTGTAKYALTFTPGLINIANTITHSLGTTDVSITLWDLTTGEITLAKVNNRTLTTIDITFTANPAGDIRVVIIG